MDVIRYYESVMAAKDVEIEGIPLPNMSSGKVKTSRKRLLGIEVVFTHKLVFI